VEAANEVGVGEEELAVEVYGDIEMRRDTE
jgi:hypothetical protein